MNGLRHSCGRFLTRVARTLAGGALLGLVSLTTVRAVDLTQVSVANISTGGFTATWRMSDVGVPGLDVYADAAGNTSLAGTVRVEFSPLGVGDVTAGSTFESRAVRRALQDVMASRLVALARVSGLAPGTTVYFRPRTFDAGGADNGSGLLPLTAVTTTGATRFVLSSRLLAVQFPGFDSEGTVALLHGPPGVGSLAAVVGDGDDADVAIFPLANLIDTATGQSADLAAATDFSITVLGDGAPAGSFLHTVDFPTTFQVGSYELFVANAVSPAPVITQHPANATVLAGQNASFTVAASGDPAPGFQWQRQAAGSGTWANVVDDATYAGATTATLTVSNVTAGMSGDQFRAIASNGVAPDATSDAATLLVNLGSSSIALSGLAHVFDGAPKSATVTTNPVGLTHTVTYDGGTTLPVNAGSYAVVATITQSGYSGSASGTLVISKAGQTITFDPLPGRALGDAPFDVSATASSGLAVAFSIVSGPATVAGNTITLTGAGNVTVRAAQAGDANFNAAPVVERTFAVAPGTATVTLGSLSQVYTATPRAATATTNPAGLTVTFTYNGSSAAPVDVGTYTVVATATNANYTGSATGTLTITKAPAIARADHKAKLQGTPNPALTITYIGLLGGDTPAGLDSLPVAVTTAVLDSPAGTYPITLSGGSDSNYDLTLQDGVLTVTAPVDTAPTINVHPLSQSVVLGNPVTLVVDASGTDPLTYQWYKNGALLPGATSATLGFASATLADAGSYSVVVANPIGSATSQLATLTVTPPPNVPTIVDQPDDTRTRRFARTVFRVGAVGDDPLTYQWRKGGTAISGATSARLVIENTQPGDAGLYSVVVTNPQGTATSRDARLTVAGRSWRGTYFGSFGNNGGSCAFYIRDDNTGVFCGFVRGSNIPLFTRDCRVDDDGRFHFTSGPRSVRSPGIAAVEPVYEFDLVIDDAGNVTGTVSGLNLTVAAALSPETGVTRDLAGFYQSGSTNSGDVSYTILGSSGEAYVVTIVGSIVDAGSGAVDSGGNVTIFTETNTVVTATVNMQAGTLVSTVTTGGGTPVSLSGANQDARDDIEKLVNISTRGPTGTGGNIVIAGFVVSGTQPKTVLIRGVGPTLGELGVPGTIDAVAMRLYSYSTLIAESGDWGAANNAAAIAAAAERVSAFPLSPLSRDSAMLITLQPGLYTAHLYGPEDQTGVSLVEVYDATDGPIPPDQRVINISTRGLVGTADDVQIAGFVIIGSVPKRVLIRGIGPGLAPYLGTGYLEDPTITIYDAAGNAIVSNDDWGTGNTALIQEVSTEVAAFPLTPGSKDSVLLVNLQPGVYTVHVRGVGGTTGVALVEVYDAP